MTWVAGILAIIAGLVMCFCGYRLFRIWLAVAGFIGGAYLGESLGKAYFAGASWPLALAIAIGLLFALLSYFLYRLGVVLTGAVLGAALVNLLLAAWSGLDAGWPILVGAVLGAILAGIFLKPYIIVGSSFNGAYLAVLGAYSIIVMKDMSRESLLSPGSGMPWYVLLGVLVLTLLGIFAQFGLNKGREPGGMAKKKPAAP
jgi:hypothetical protein